MDKFIILASILGGALSFSFLATWVIFKAIDYKLKLEKR